MKAFLSLQVITVIFLRSLLPGLEFSQLKKIPALIHHYQEHKLANGNLSFMVFLQMHYADEKHHGQDQQEHHKLPFQDHQSAPGTAYALFMVDRNFTLPINWFPIGSANQSIYQSMVEEGIASHVWQPPRKC